MPDDLPANFVGAISRPFSGSKLFSRKSSERMEKSLAAAGIAGASGQGYLSGALFASALFALAALFIAILFGHGVALLLAAFFLPFGAVFSCFLLLPSLLASRRAALIDAELPFIMREFSTYLQIGLPFEKCVLRAAGGDYALSQDFAQISRETKSGSSMQTALSNFSSRSQSMQVKRFSLVLSQAYETGSGVEQLKRMSEEMALSQLSKIREQGGRLSLISILFIATSAMLPAFFCVFAALSPLVSGEPLPLSAIWAAFLLGFPLLNLLVLSLAFLSLPPSPFSQSGGQGMVGEFLQKSKIPLTHRQFAVLLSLLALMLSALSFAFFGLAAAVMAICVAPAIYSAALYLSNREIARAEACLPDALYSAASVHKVMSAERTLAYLAASGFGRLSESFEIALRRQKAGEGFASSMAAASRHCPSPLVSRAFALLVVAYETGADMYFALREAAQDVMGFFSLVRERAAMLSIQRYTLILAAALLVPVILGTTVSLVPALSSSSSQQIASQPSALLAQPAAQAGTFATLTLACRCYLLASALLSSAMLSWSESDPRRALLYFSAIAPISQLAFSAVSGAGFSA